MSTWNIVNIIICNQIILALKGAHCMCYNYMYVCGDFICYNVWAIM